MKVTRALAGACAAVGWAAQAPAQHIVYDNTGPVIAWWTQIEAKATSGPEGGDEIILGEGGRQVQQFEFWYQVGGASASGQASLRARFYANDGPAGAPGTVLWDSGLQQGVAHISGSNHLVLAVPSTSVPDRFTWTVEFIERSGSTIEALGLRIFDPPVVGQSSPDFIWMRDGSGAFIQATFGGITPANLGARITVAGAPIFRTCCLPDATCVPATISDCFAIGGASGSGVCSAACPTFRACCFPDGACLELTEQGCLAAGGIWDPSSTVCAAANCILPLHVNGPLATSKVRGGIYAPYDTFWSDVYSVAGCQTQYVGYSADDNAGYRHADDFVIPAGESWNIEAIDIYSFAAGGSASVSPLAGATLRIWRGRPGVLGSEVVWGDLTTNVSVNSVFSRIFKYTTSYPIFRHRLDVGATLPPGEYWIDYSFRRSPPGDLYAPFVTIPNQLGKAGANAIYSIDGGMNWEAVVDEPHPAASCSPIPQDFPFAIVGEIVEPSPCYANCDQSTEPPVLNVDDFTCFINQYAAGLSLPSAQQFTHYANCDQSTVPPILNVDDFTCFINAYAAGCS